jgi:hypothetical protein
MSFGQASMERFTETQTGWSRVEDDPAVGPDPAGVPPA